MKVSVFLFLWILSVSRGDPEVFCVFMERCILPCSFQVGPQVVIHWNHMTKEGELPVHSYYDNQDHLGHQDQMFRNRTSLFQDQISRGNASLQLTGVKVQDEGRYQCYISTINGDEESFINLKVYAPVLEVSIQQVENRITCSSEGIYPEPELTWSTTPPSNINLHNTTTVQQNQQQLYSISSSLILSHSDTDLVYSCTVTNHRNSWTTTSRHQTVENSSETTIPCTTSNSGLSSFSLVWRFNHSQMILNQTSADLTCTITPEWKQYVKDVSESGDIKLQDLSSDQEGIYTCQLSNAKETSVTNTILRIENYRGDPSTEPGGSVAVIVGVVVLSIVVLAALVLVVFYICRHQQNQENERPNRRENNHPGEGVGEELHQLANGEDEAAQVPAALEN